MFTVESSNVKAIGYDLHSETLRVEFASGTYEYASVPAVLVPQVMFAESVGGALNSVIKNNGFAFTKIMPVEATK